VPLGPRRVLGCVWGPAEGGIGGEAAPVARVLPVPPLRPALRAFLARAADYTLTPLTGMLRLATRAPGLGEPPAQRRLCAPTGASPTARPKPAPACSTRSRPTAALGETAAELAREAGVSGSVVKGLVEQGVLEEITAPATRPCRARRPPRRAHALRRPGGGGRPPCATRWGRGYSATLLKGVTGSGKTETYLEAVAECLRAGRQALVMLPEIALTVDFLARVEARFGARPPEWHSGVTATSGGGLWEAAATGEARLVVGARSALFLPFAELGLIVVDEEHDGSYKQEDGASTTPATWPCCAPRSRVPRWCSPRPPPRSRPGPTPRPASTPASTCPSASARR
jgi:primosomal protein N' (replication factor Y) (superfamily II helicase)